MDILTNNALQSNETISKVFQCDNQTEFLTKPPDYCIDNDMKLTETNIITIIIYFIVFLFSSVFNLSMLILLCSNKRYGQTRVQRFMSHLNIADLIVTFITIPLEMGWKYSVVWLAGDFGCRFFQFLRPLGIYLSSFILISISIDRYHAILDPLGAQKAERRTRCLIILSWVLSVICSIPQMAVFSLKNHPVHKWYHQCVDFNIDGTHKITFLSYQVFVSIITFFLPLLVISYTYGCIIHKIVNTLDLHGDDSYSNLSTQALNVKREVAGFSSARVERIKKAKIRTLKLTAIIISVFLISWCPYYLISVWFWIDPISAAKVDSRIAEFLFIFAVCHCVANPLVYGLYTMNLSKQMKFGLNFNKFKQQNYFVEKSLNDNVSVAQLSDLNGGAGMRKHVHCKNNRAIAEFKF